MPNTVNQNIDAKRIRQKFIALFFNYFSIIFYLFFVKKKINILFFLQKNKAF